MMKSFDIKPPADLARQSGHSGRRRPDNSDTTNFAGSMDLRNKPAGELASAEPVASPINPFGAVTAIKTEVHFDTSRILARSTPPDSAEVSTAEPLKILKIELGPDDGAGSIKAVLRLKNQNLDVRLQADRSDVAARLHNAAPELTASLENAGYSVGEVSAQLAPKPAQTQSTTNQTTDTRRGRGAKSSSQENDDDGIQGALPAGSPVFL